MKRLIIALAIIALLPAAGCSRVPDGFVRIKGGAFLMGSPETEPERQDNEGPQRKVKVRSFYMGIYPVTQNEYLEIMGTYTGFFGNEELFPIEGVNWFEAVEYCNRRSEFEGLTPAYIINGENISWNRKANGYRLPTEAEWEYVCRAGTTTPFSTGFNITTDQANYKGDAPYNDNEEGEFRNVLTIVGTFDANPWGLYDMHGNVWEWCWDRYGEYISGAVKNPVGAARGIDRICRGGSWNNNGQGLRSANRGNLNPAARADSIGFRVVRNIR